MIHPLNKRIDECRACKGSLTPLFSLGNLYISDFPQEPNKGERSPLNLVQCDNCGLVQLEHSVNRDRLFKQFWYQSSLSRTMKDQLAIITMRAIQTVGLQAGDTVLDIGCNDGTLLDQYPTPEVERVGFEPAVNMAILAEKRGLSIINDYFSASSYRKHGHNDAKIITTVAMFYDLDDPTSFVGDIAEILAGDGVWIDQQNYLYDMLKNNNYDNILHEHLCYYSQDSFVRILEEHGLELFKTETNMVNGGSFRSYICHKGMYGKSFMLHEEPFHLRNLETYQRFNERIHEQANLLNHLISDLIMKHKTVYAYGCGTRGNTILQYSHLTNQMIMKGCDANSDKWGRYTVGTNIPIINKEQARNEKPDYFLILPYHFRSEIIQSEKEYLANGGRIIFPLPTLEVYPN